MGEARFVFLSENEAGDGSNVGTEGSESGFDDLCKISSSVYNRNLFSKDFSNKIRRMGGNYS